MDDGELVVLDTGFSMFGQGFRHDLCSGLCCCVCAGSGELSSCQTTIPSSQEDPACVESSYAHHDDLYHKTKNILLYLNPLVLMHRLL
ncbi:unnamed protein product [Boreogadus saida]